MVIANLMRLFFCRHKSLKSALNEHNLINLLFKSSNLQNFILPCAGLP